MQNYIDVTLGGPVPDTVLRMLRVATALSGFNCSLQRLENQKTLRFTTDTEDPKQLAALQTWINTKIYMTMDYVKALKEMLGD